MDRATYRESENVSIYLAIGIKLFALLRKKRQVGPKWSANPKGFYTLTVFVLKWITKGIQHSIGFSHT